MNTKDYSLAENIGVVANEDLDDFWKSAEDGDNVDVVIEGTGQTVPLVMLDTVKKKYGSIAYADEYGDKVFVYGIFSCDNLLYVAGIDADDFSGGWEDDEFPNRFFPISSYSINPLDKALTAERIESLRDQKVEIVDAFETGSKFGGWPVNALGERMKSWPHYKGHPLVFNAQYELPDGRMVWVFVDGVEALQTVCPMEKYWDGDDHYVKGMTGAELFDIIERLYGRDKWHYENREFVGQKRPVTVSFDTWQWEDNGIAVIVEGGSVPSWITMKKPLKEMLPFLTVSEKAVSFPAGVRHTPLWVQQEKDDAYEFRQFLFQIDDGVGDIDFPYGDLGSVYIYWNGKDAGVGLMQCH